jgi:hypothetical protein
MAKVPTMVRLDENDKAALEQQAAARDRSLSYLVACAVRKWLAAESPDAVPSDRPAAAKSTRRAAPNFKPSATKRKASK